MLAGTTGWAIIRKSRVACGANFANVGLGNDETIMRTIFRSHSVVSV